jgi:hypothetical protein
MALPRALPYTLGSPVREPRRSDGVGDEVATWRDAEHLDLLSRFPYG